MIFSSLVLKTKLKKNQTIIKRKIQCHRRWRSRQDYRNKICQTERWIHITPRKVCQEYTLKI